MARRTVRKRTLDPICGQIRAQLQKLGTPIGSYDLQIAAIALANNLILVAHNTREFERVEGLKLEDWQE
jgi:tRNA(fMet)-specific endonuclease VapC